MVGIVHDLACNLVGCLYSPVIGRSDACQYWQERNRSGAEADALGPPGGAPTGACTSMSPRHRLNGSSTRYSVVTMTSSYKTGDAARRTSGNTPLGRWRTPPANTKLITCTNENDAITHDNTMVKTRNAVYEWVPSQNYGDIQFV
ncbi:unnamed protein product [Clavelina lepadiformis]|uniref:Reelin domain-containing protein n=1 Tax=Clavelina lepadiformis TaxID=159417 RepID=A0ABP0G9S1_CLALP